MKSKLLKTSLLIVVLFICFGAITFNGTAYGKIATADISKIYQNSIKVKKSQYKLKKSAENASSALQKMINDVTRDIRNLQNLSENFNKSSSTEIFRERIRIEGQKKQQLIFSKQQQIERYKIEMNQNLQQQENDMTKSNLLEIGKIVSKYANDNSIEMIYNYSESSENLGVLIFSDKKFDLTDILSELVNDKISLS